MGLTTAFAQRVKRNQVKPIEERLVVPKVSSISQRKFPPNLEAEQIFVRVADNFRQESRDRGDDFLLADQIAKELEGLLHSATSFASDKETAKLIFDIHVGAASTGNRNWLGSMMTQLAFDFSIYDRTKEEKPIVKHGKVVYVNPHKGMGRKTGEKSMRSVLPVVARQLLSEVPIETNYSSSVLA